jgi:hypothetical protein
VVTSFYHSQLHNCAHLGAYVKAGEVQSLAYWTIIGRIDQFALGMLAFQLRSYATKRHGFVAFYLTSFLLFYWYFDAQGGFMAAPSYPSPQSALDNSSDS